MAHDSRINRAKAAEVAHAGDVGDGVRLPGEPLAGLPAMLFVRAFEGAGDAGKVIQNHVRLHDGETPMLEYGHLGVAIDGKVRGEVLGASLEIDGPKGKRQARQRQKQYRLIG